jgi:hypothetical protein
MAKNRLCGRVPNIIRNYIVKAYHKKRMITLAFEKMVL